MGKYFIGELFIHKESTQVLGLKAIWKYDILKFFIYKKKKEVFDFQKVICVSDGLRSFLFTPILVKNETWLEETQNFLTHANYQLSIFMAESYVCS